MIASDHLEWHGTHEAYVDAKKNIVRFQKPEHVAVLNENDPHSHAFARETKARVVRFGSKDHPPFELSVVGVHNQTNAQAAFVAARELGVAREAASSALREFRGLPHRLQLVHEHEGVKWINDSIATIPQAAIAACDAFPPGKVIQIVGGYDKHLDMSEMCAHLAKHCKGVLTIGTLGPALASMMRESQQRVADVRECHDLSNAVAIARSLAVAGDVVLLSTGCASYDQFANFESRGDAFTRLARQQR
jgi:UDP-N-acetylmuramoylalanine--D-glutamate ligase